jgi:hypothetical protein
MNWKHLFWIVPLCLILGGFVALKTMSEIIDWTAWELTVKAVSKLEDASLAWEETPLSEGRVFFNGEFCYLINEVPTCPKRNLTDLSFDEAQKQ